MIKKGDRVQVKADYVKLYHALNKTNRRGSLSKGEVELTVLGIDDSINEANVSGLWMFVPLEHLELWKPAKPKKDVTK